MIPIVDWFAMFDQCLNLSRALEYRQSTTFLWVETNCMAIQFFLATLAKHNLFIKIRAQSKLHPRNTQHNQRDMCVVLSVFPQMATQGIQYQLHLLPKSLFASVVV